MVFAGTDFIIILSDGLCYSLLIYYFLVGTLQKKNCVLEFWLRNVAASINQYKHNRVDSDETTKVLVWGPG